jgi:hypothetical protein
MPARRTMDGSYAINLPLSFPFAEIPERRGAADRRRCRLPDEFALTAQDSVRITISGVGTLENPVAVV